MTRRTPLRHFSTFLPCLLALALSCAPADGNGDRAETTPQAAEATMVRQPPPADPADVESVEAIVHAVYDVISGEAGEARDWDRWHSLFLPTARLHPVAAEGDGWTVANTTPEAFASSADSSFTADGFYEIEIGSVTEVYGNIAHRFSSYASYRSETDTEPFNRGINSFQLLNDGERWWVLSILWQHEFQGGTIPDEYLDEP